MFPDFFLGRLTFLITPIRKKMDLNFANVNSEAGNIVTATHRSKFLAFDAKRNFRAGNIVISYLFLFFWLYDGLINF